MAAELGLTQKELAEKLNISDRTVSKWERGAGFPDISLVEPLADALGLSVLELLHGEESPEAPPGSDTSARETLRVLWPQVGARLKRAKRWLTAEYTHPEPGAAPRYVLENCDNREFSQTVSKRDLLAPFHSP